jgi:hypothetical protein
MIDKDFFGPVKLKGMDRVQEILDRNKPHPENMKYFLSEYVRIKKKISELSRSKRDYVESRVDSWIAAGYCEHPMKLKQDHFLLNYKTEMLCLKQAKNLLELIKRR